MNNTVMTSQLSVPQWLQLSQEVRRKLRDQFGLARSGGSEVQQIGGKSVQISDGHTHQDLQAITLEKLQEFTESDSTDFYGLLNQLVDKLMEVKKVSVEDLAKEASEKFMSRVTNMLVTINLEAKSLGLEEEVKKLFELAHGKITSTSNTVTKPSQAQSRTKKHA